MSRTIDGNPRTMPLHRVLASWGEAGSNAPDEEGKGADAEPGDVTWLHRFFDTTFWSQQGGDFSATISGATSVGTANGFYAWNTAGMLADVQFWMANPGSNFGWVLLGTEGNAIETARQFHTRESSNASRRPKLTVEYTPPAQVGACCFPDGSCSVSESNDCVVLGGDFHGVGTVCVPNPCPPDTDGPVVVVVFQNGGEVIGANTATNVSWSATDPSGVAAVDIYHSMDGGASWRPVARSEPNTGSITWIPPNRPGSNALIRVVATDFNANEGQDDSDAPFSITSPPPGRVATTLRDFDMPGSQPLELDASLANPQQCASCHGGYDTAGEPYFNWQGSMMSHAGRDLLFEANMVIANQDASESGDLCLRCHLHTGWAQGRSIPTDGSSMLPTDETGVSCDLCHRMVDPIYEPGVSPLEDVAVLAALSMPGTNFSTGTLHLDQESSRRGPFADSVSTHSFLVSPFHREAALCGTCHDVSNPAFARDGAGNYVAGPLDAMATNFSSHSLAPVERTYSEWFYSDYNTSNGVHAPQFAGNKADGRVAICQDCHMRDISGQGCDPAQFPAAPVRPDMPLHDMTGGSVWLPPLLAAMHPGEVNSNAVAAGIDRARYMLSNAASMTLGETGPILSVVITNECGHKLPTGYPEGRRMWLNVQFYDPGSNLVTESGAYDAGTGVLTHDAEAKIYEVKPGIDTNLAAALGLDPGPSFHFVLNNDVFKDNRIPPRGFNNADYASFGGPPVDYSYADGQFWDETLYVVPEGATRAEVRLYYQSTSKEFVEFLRDENTTDLKGQAMYDLWNDHGKCPPETMVQGTWYIPLLLDYAGMTPSGVVEIGWHCRPGTSYTIEYTDEDLVTPVWHPFNANGTIVASGPDIVFIDDFTPNTSGGPSLTGVRAYRVSYLP